MLLTYKDLPKINFPLFVLKSDDWFWSDKVLFIGDQVLDERNMPGKTLGIRRLQCRRKDLYPLKKAVMDVPQMLKSKHKAYIDVKGKPFLYLKTRMCKLDCYQIKRIEGKNTASLLWLHGIDHPFTVPRPPSSEFKWVRILHLESEPWLIYDYVRLKKKTTYRRV